MKRGKKYLESLKLVDRTKLYDPTEALEVVQKAARAKFDETVEAHIKLGVDSRHADQQVRVQLFCPMVQAEPCACLCSPRAKRLPRLSRMVPIM